MLYYNNAAKDVKIKQYYDVILFEVLSYESSITQFLDIFLDFDRKKKFEHYFTLLSFYGMLEYSVFEEYIQIWEF